VILLTQVGSPAERAVALDEGADDYLNKPFEPYELVARIRAVLRRSRRARLRWRSASAAVGPVGPGPADAACLFGWASSALTTKAVSILEYLMLHPDEALSRERLLDAVWGWTIPPPLAL